MECDHIAHRFCHTTIPREMDSPPAVECDRGGRALSEENPMNSDIQDYKAWCADNCYDVLPGDREQIIKYRVLVSARRKPERVAIIMSRLADFYRVHVGPDNCCAGIDGIPEFVPRVIRTDIEPTETETGLFGIERGDGECLPGTVPTARQEREPIKEAVLRGDGAPLDQPRQMKLDKQPRIANTSTECDCAPSWFRTVCWPDRVPLADAARYINAGKTALHAAAIRGRVPRNPDGTFHIKDVELWAARRGQAATA